MDNQFRHRGPVEQARLLPPATRPLIFSNWSEGNDGGGTDNAALAPSPAPLPLSADHIQDIIGFSGEPAAEVPPDSQDLALAQAAAYEASIDSTCRDTEDCNCYWCRKARLQAMGVRLTLRERAEENGLDEDHSGGWIGLATVLRGMGEISDDGWEEISKDWLPSGSESCEEAGGGSADCGYHRTTEDAADSAEPEAPPPPDDEEGEPANEKQSIDEDPACQPCGSGGETVCGDGP